MVSKRDLFWAVGVLTVEQRRDLQFEATLTPRQRDHRMSRVVRALMIGASIDRKPEAAVAYLTRLLRAAIRSAR